MPLESPASGPAHRRTGLRAVVLIVVALVGVTAACGGAEEGISAEASTARAPSTDVPGTSTTTSEADGTTTSEADGVQPIGFTTMTVRITEAGGEVCELCVWLADVGDERTRGLMGVTDLGEAAGMLFVYPSPVASNFYMFQTPTPLSIAWFSEDGSFVGEADMAPCLGVPADDCERYTPDAEYTMALEVWEGELPGLGIGAGARLEVVEGSETAACASL